MDRGVADSRPRCYDVRTLQPDSIEIRPLEAQEVDLIEGLAQELGRDPDQVEDLLESMAHDGGSLCLAWSSQEEFLGALLAWVENTLQPSMAEDVVLVEDVLFKQLDGLLFTRLLSQLGSEMESRGLERLPLEIRLPLRLEFEPPPGYRRSWERECSSHFWWRLDWENGGTE